MLHPQGKNVKEDQFEAIGNMLSTATWELPNAQEFQNDLVQPDFLGVQAIPPSTSVAVVPTPKIDPNAPASDEQWKKMNKMVAWLDSDFVFRKYPFPPFPQSCVFVH